MFPFISLNMNFLYFEVEFAIPSISIYLPQIIKKIERIFQKWYKVMFVSINNENIENGKENLKVGY